jgi:hypothetical protein
VIKDEDVPSISPAVRFLDKHYPGWADKVDLRKLAMASTKNCIIGQVTGKGAGWGIGGSIVDTTTWKEIVPNTLGEHFSKKTESQWRAIVGARQ